MHGMDGWLRGFYYDFTFSLFLFCHFRYFIVSLMSRVVLLEYRTKKNS